MIHIKSDLNHFFRFLAENGYLSKNPLNEVKFSRRYSLRRDRVILSHGEVLEALAAMKELSPTVVYPFIFSLAHTGARREEIRLLKWEHIDFPTGYIVLKRTKSGHDRSIRMGPSLAAFLKTLPKISDWVFMSQFGWLLSRSQIDENIEILRRKHPEMKRWRCHDLRHSFAFNFLKLGGDMYALKASLGHAKIELTVDLYGHFKAQDAERVSPYE
jgi:integrase